MRTNLFINLISCLIFIGLILLCDIRNGFGQTDEAPEIIIQNGHTAPVQSVCFSPNGEFLASASSDGILKLWQVNSDILVQSIDLHSSINNIIFSPDSKIIACACYDATVKLLDTNSWMIIRMFKGHSANVRSVSFSPDGQILVSASDDSTIKFWETNSGRLILTLEEHITSAIFSSYGKKSFLKVRTGVSSYGKPVQENLLRRSKIVSLVLLILEVYHRMAKRLHYDIGKTLLLFLI